jgi:hypothetical protein
MENGHSIGFHWPTLLTGRKGLLVERTRLIALALFLSWLSIAQAAAFTGQVVRVLAGDTLEVLHNQRPDRTPLPQSQRHLKERRDPLNRKNGEAHILAGHHLLYLSYGNHKIRAASPTNTLTKAPKAMPISMIASWVDGGFEYGFL